MYRAIVLMGANAAGVDSFHFFETVYIDSIHFTDNGDCPSPWLKVITLLPAMKSRLSSS